MLRLLTPLLRLLTANTPRSRFPILTNLRGSAQADEQEIADRRGKEDCRLACLSRTFFVAPRALVGVEGYTRW